MNFEDLTFSDKGVEVFIRASKTDKSFKGQSIAVPNGRIIRPVAHLEKWLEAATSHQAQFSDACLKVVASVNPHWMTATFQKSSKASTRSELRP